MKLINLTTKHLTLLWFSILSCLLILTSLNAVEALPQAANPTNPNPNSNTNTNTNSNSQPSPSPSSNSFNPPSLTTSILTTTLTSGRFPSGQRSSSGLSGSRSNNVLITQVRLTVTPSTSPSPTVTSSSSSSINSTSSIDSLPRLRSEPDYSDSLPLKSYIDPAFGILGAVLILSGLFTAFCGIKSSFSTCGFPGFYTGALVVICVILKLGVEKAINDPSKTVRGLFLLASLIAGALLGLLCLVFDTEGLFLCLTLAGFLLGLFIQALKSNGVIAKIGYRFILYSSLGGFFFALNLIRHRNFKLILAIVSTSVIGSTAVILGIDCFTTSGLKEFYIRNLGFDQLFENKAYQVIDSRVLPNGTVIGTPINREIRPFQNGNWPLVTGEIIELSILGGLTLISVAAQLQMWILSRKARENQKATEKESKRDRKKAEKAANRISKDAERELREWEIKHGYVKAETRKEEEEVVEEEEEQEGSFGRGHKKFRSFASFLPQAMRVSSRKKDKESSSHELGERERTLSAHSRYQSSLGTSTTMIGGSSPYAKNASISSKTSPAYAYQTLPNVTSPGTPETQTQTHDYLNAGFPRPESTRNSIASTPPVRTNSGSNRLSTTSIVGGNNRRTSLIDYLRQGPIPGSVNPNVDGSASLDDDGRRPSNATLPNLDLGESIEEQLTKPRDQIPSSEKDARDRAKSEHESLLEEIARLRGSIQQLKSNTPDVPPSGIGFTSASSVGMGRQRRNTIESATVLDLETAKPPSAAFPNPAFPAPSSSRLLQNATSSDSNSPSPATSSSYGNERRNSSGSMLNSNAGNAGGGSKRNTFHGGKSGYEIDSPSSGSNGKGVLPYNHQDQARKIHHSHSKSHGQPSSLSRATSNPLLDSSASKSPPIASFNRPRPKSAALLDPPLQHLSPTLRKHERRIIDTQEEAEARYASALGRHPPKRSSTIQPNSSTNIPTPSSPSGTLTMAELREKHRLKLAKMQGGVTREMEEKEMLRKAKEAWERRREWERKVWQEKARRLESEKESLRLKEEELKKKSGKTIHGKNGSSSSPMPSPILKPTSSQEFRPDGFHQSEFKSGSMESRLSKRASGIDKSKEWRSSLTPGSSPILQTSTLPTIHSRSRSTGQMESHSSPLPSPNFAPTNPLYGTGSGTEPNSPNLNSANRNSFLGDQIRPPVTRNSTNNTSFHTARSNSNPNTPMNESSRPTFPSSPSSSQASPKRNQMDLPSPPGSPSRETPRELSETDRRRLSQGAAGGDRALRHRREMSAGSLIRFDTDILEEAWKNKVN